MLQSGVANLTALAVKIKPEVERLVDSRVSTNTIVASLKRVSDRLAQSQEVMKSDRKKPIDLKMSLTDSIIDFVLDEGSLGDFSEIYDKLSGSREIPFSIFQTSKNCRLYTDDPSLFDDLEQKYSEHFKVEAGKKFTKVTIDFSEGNKQEAALNNLLSEISNILYNSDISIHSAFFTPSEIIFIADNTNAIKLYDRLHNELIKS